MSSASDLTVGLIMRHHFIPSDRYDSCNGRRDLLSRCTCIGCRLILAVSTPYILPAIALPSMTCKKTVVKLGEYSANRRIAEHALTPSEARAWIVASMLPDHYVNLRRTLGLPLCNVPSYLIAYEESASSAHVASYSSSILAHCHAVSSPHCDGSDR